MASQKIYVGNGRKKSPTWLKLSIDLSKADQYGKISEKNGKKYLNLDINIKDQADQYGFDVAATIDEYDPKKNGAGRNVPPPPPAAAAAPASQNGATSHGIGDFDGDLPF